jgi:dolichyl-phosphate-mannose-protein mannosyltransferase
MYKTHVRAFSFMWWYPLFMTGLCLGLSVSVKWVGKLQVQLRKGLFVIATVGVSTIKNLWNLLEDERLTWASRSVY